MADWYYAVNDQQRGPVTQDRLAGMIAAGQIAPTDLVWTDGIGTWAPAAQVPGLVPAGVAGPSRGRAAAEEEFPKWRGMGGPFSGGQGRHFDRHRGRTRGDQTGFLKLPIFHLHGVYMARSCRRGEADADDNHRGLCEDGRGGASTATTSFSASASA